MENETAAEASALVVSRSFDAPREAVFDAWLDPAQLAIWMGPHGVRAEIDALEPKEGGKYRIIMHPEPGRTVWYSPGHGRTPTRMDQPVWKPL